ncbi:NUDIX hydrolase [Plectonema cf. radiosum LEGE 06105]|uniref:NUDIX hydrolase n=1 Tax=Plectonema cf. radiosum LEGE 06105 TaxID=945769 RepID=A0A8J7FMQ1_9CYAN|nr:NUDIX hydrolase [Plectonema radiosum]MBE9216206.1 NUDIX hydrolase [Plectonema cf. radiosum LEGE 06105]
MYKEGKIRVLALGLIRDSNNRTFVSEGYDPVKKDKFYRAMGGGVEFGETSKQALQREFQEEIQAEITNIRYLTCLENIFTFQGKSAHEIIQLFECDFVHPKFYQQETIPFNEGEREKTALWIDIGTFKSGTLRLVPELFVDYL